MSNNVELNIALPAQEVLSRLASAMHREPYRPIEGTSRQACIAGEIRGNQLVFWVRYRGDWNLHGPMLQGLVETTPQGAHIKARVSTQHWLAGFWITMMPIGMVFLVFCIAIGLLITLLGLLSGNAQRLTGHPTSTNLLAFVGAPMLILLAWVVSAKSINHRIASDKKVLMDLLEKSCGNLP